MARPPSPDGPSYCLRPGNGRNGGHRQCGCYGCANVRRIAVRKLGWTFPGVAQALMQAAIENA